MIISESDIRRLARSVLYEVRVKDFRAMFVGRNITEEEYGRYIFDVRRNKFRRPFNDNLYLEILKNSYEAGEEVDLDEFVSAYDTIKRDLFDRFYQQGSLEIYDYRGKPLKIDRLEGLTFESIKKALSLLQGGGSSSSVYREALEETSESNFELVHSDENWIVFYPKTVIGSIALGRSYWDGSKLVYDETFDASVPGGEKCGKMRWCTVKPGGSNLFNNYHVAKNLHMYYCIKKDYRADDINNKLCLSFKKEMEGSIPKVEYRSDSGMSVNAINGFITLSEARSLLGSEAFRVLFKNVEREDRLVFDEEEFYRSVSLEQYKVLKRGFGRNINDLLENFEGFIKFSRDKDKIVREEALSGNQDFRTVILKVFNKAKKALPEELLVAMSSEPSEFLCAAIIQNAGATEDLLRKFSSDGRSEVVQALIKSEVCPREILLKYSRSHVGHKSIVASSSKIDEEIVDNILSGVDNAIDKNTIFKSLLSNRACPSESLKRIFYLEGTKVGHKRSIMSNPSIDKDFIRSVYQEYLTKSEMDKNFIMTAIASNESCPTDILQELSKSAYHLTKKIALETLRKKRRLENKLLKKYIDIILG